MEARTNTYTYGLCEIVVHRPALDDKERHKREDTLRRAVAAFGKELHKSEVTMNAAKKATLAPVHG